MEQQLDDTSRLLKESTSEKASLKGLVEEYEQAREEMEEEVVRRRAHAEVLLKLSNRRLHEQASASVKPRPGRLGEASAARRDSATSSIASRSWM